MELTKKGSMAVAGHRGDCYNESENTMEAFRAAIRGGVDMIETDVQMSKDGHLVLIHDHTVDRTTNGIGRVSELTFEQLRGLNAGLESYPAQIPTLEELLQMLSDTDVTLNLEVKEYSGDGNLGRCQECIEKCVELVERYGFGEKMVFNSFDAYVLEYLEEHYPGKYKLHGFYPYSIMSHVVRNPDEYLYCACIFESGNQKHYDDLIQRGIEPWIGASVTQQARLAECFSRGARLVTTNNPVDCIEKLQKTGCRK